MQTAHQLSVCAATLALSAQAVFCAGSFDWPQWQGPDRNAISTETGLLKEWPKDGPPLAWKATSLGGGDSAPFVADGRIFLMSTRGDEEVVLALSKKDGKELWVARLGLAVQQRMPQSNEGPGCTPTVDGEPLFVLGMGVELAGLQVQDGKVIWQRNLQADLGGSTPTWSYRESPLVDGDKLICTPGADDATLVALNKLTGETIWKNLLPDGSGDNPGGPGGPSGGRGGFGGFSRSGAAYSSVIAIHFEGERQYVQLAA